jgi:hypothetical protein
MIPTAYELRRLSDEELAELPLVSVHNEPQLSPQEYDCGCVTVTRITDRDFLRGEQPFEMRLAHQCGSADCEQPTKCEQNEHLPGSRATRWAP